MRFTLEWARRPALAAVLVGSGLSGSFYAFGPTLLGFWLADHDTSEALLKQNQTAIEQGSEALRNNNRALEALIEAIGDADRLPAPPTAPIKPETVVPPIVPGQPQSKDVATPPANAGRRPAEAVAEPPKAAPAPPSIASAPPALPAADEASDGPPVVQDPAGANDNAASPVATDKGPTAAPEPSKPAATPPAAAPAAPPAGPQAAVASRPSAPTVFGVFEQQRFDLCGYSGFTARIASGNSIVIASEDRSIPDRTFRGYERSLPAEELVELWSGCVVGAGYSSVNGIDRIVFSVAGKG